MLTGYWFAKKRYSFGQVVGGHMVYRLPELTLGRWSDHHDRNSPSYHICPTTSVLSQGGPGSNHTIDRLHV